MPLITIPLLLAKPTLAKYASGTEITIAHGQPVTRISNPLTTYSLQSLVIKPPINNTKAEIITIERNPVMIENAKNNFSLYDKNKKITLLEGDAANLLPEIYDSFDLIFLDAAKGQYPNYLPDIKRLLSEGGVFISDNVLFNGFVAKGTPDRHRNKTIVMRLDEYLRMLESDKDFKTVLLPISDGVTLSIKKYKSNAS